MPTNKTTGARGPTAFAHARVAKLVLALLRSPVVVTAAYPGPNAV